MQYIVGIAEIKTKPSGYQLNHLAFELPPSAFAAQHAAFLATGFQTRDGKHPVFANSAMYIDDPNGNEVEFICHAH